MCQLASPSVVSTSTLSNLSCLFSLAVCSLSVPDKESSMENIYFKLFSYLLGRLREQGWRSGESTRLPPMWPGLDFRFRRHMWAICGLSLVLYPGACFSNVPRLFGPISSVTIPFISSQRRGSKPSNFAILLVFLILKTC